jgi:hypothetical protein
MQPYHKWIRCLHNGLDLGLSSIPLTGITLHGRMDFWRMAANYIYLLLAILLGHAFVEHSEHRSLTVSRKWTCAKPSPSSAGMSRLDVLNFACSELDCFAGQDQLFWLVFCSRLSSVLGRINCLGAITISSMHHPTLFFRIFLEPSQLSFGECNKTGTSRYKVLSQLAFWATLRGTVQ